MALTDQDPQVDEEALRTLYRLRTQLTEQATQPPGFLKAIESLIKKYEAKRI